MQDLATTREKDKTYVDGCHRCAVLAGIKPPAPHLCAGDWLTSLSCDSQSLRARGKLRSTVTITVVGQSIDKQAVQHSPNSKTP